MPKFHAKTHFDFIVSLLYLHSQLDDLVLHLSSGTVRDPLLLNFWSRFFVFNGIIFLMVQLFER